MPLHQRPITPRTPSERGRAASLASPGRTPARAAPIAGPSRPSASGRGHDLAAVRVSDPAAAPVQLADAAPATVIQRNGDGKKKALRRVATLAGHLTSAQSEPPNRFAGAIVDREPGRGPAVQGPLSLDAHRLLISRGLNVRSSNLNTFEAAARRLARERAADDALLEESRGLLADPRSSLSQLHHGIRTALAGRLDKPLAEVPDDPLVTVHELRRMASKDRGVVADRTDPAGQPTHPTGASGAFTELDPGHRALAALGLSSQSGTSGSAADAVRGLAGLLGPDALAGQEENLVRLTHLYMRHPVFHRGIGSQIEQIKQQRGLEPPTPEDVAALPASHTHSLGEIAQGVHLQVGLSRGTIDPERIPRREYLTGAATGLRLLASALAGRRRRASL